MPLALLKKLPGTMPHRFEAVADIEKVSKLVFANLVEAEFAPIERRADLYRGARIATVTAITELGWQTLSQDGEGTDVA